MYFIIHMCSAFVCPMGGFPEDGIEKIKTFWSFSGLYVKVCVCVCVVAFVYLWVESDKSNYHVLLQVKLPKTFRLLL